MAKAGKRRAEVSGAAGGAVDDDVAAAGWKVLCERLESGRYRMSEEYVAKLIEKLESEIHGRGAAVRRWMHDFLVAVARRSPALAERSLASAERIGRFTMEPGGEVDAAASIRQSLAEAERGQV